jgi:hypothetical protein
LTVNDVSAAEPLAGDFNELASVVSPEPADCHKSHLETPAPMNAQLGTDLA